MSAKILVVEDEPAIADAVGYALAEAGYEVDMVGDGDDAIAAARQTRYDLMVLDLLLPGTQGLDVCRTLRSESDLPIVMLTAREAEVDRVVGLEVGADDYVAKPFSPKELVARVRAVLRRARPIQPTRVLAVGPVTLDPERHTVTLGGKALQLTPKEFDLLQALLEAAGRVLSREYLLNHVWGYARADEIESRTVDVHVRRLRAKLGDAGSRIATIKSVGYRFEVDPA